MKGNEERHRALTGLADDIRYGYALASKHSEQELIGHA